MRITVMYRRLSLYSSPFNYLERLYVTMPNKFFDAQKEYKISIFNLIFVDRNAEHCHY